MAILNLYENEKQALDELISFLKINWPLAKFIVFGSKAKGMADELEQMVDEFICIETPIDFKAVGDHYYNFTQVSDEEVVKLLQRSKRTIMEWNILATANRRQERYLLRLLSKYGEFKGSGYRDVVIGRVEDVNTFLGTLETMRQEKPEKLRPLSQIVPIERTFQFELSDFKDTLREAISPYVELIENSRFYVRVERRGHKGEISSLEVEQEMDAFVLEALKNTGKLAQVSFKYPEKIIIVETIENRAGVGLVTREMKEKYPFIKVK